MRLLQPDKTLCIIIRRHCALLIATTALAACSNFGGQSSGVDANGCAVPDNATGLRLELVGQQMASGQYHAALAHLDTIDRKLPQAQLMRARSLRAIHDSNAAEASYRTLLESCLAAYAHQGLGIVAADRRDLDEAITQLRTARQLAPVDADIRNDYGFVLLAAGRINDSLRELRTAVELETDNPIAARNLVLALFVARRDDEARATGHSHAFSDSDIDALSTRARNYKPLAQQQTKPAQRITLVYKKPGVATATNNAAAQTNTATAVAAAPVPATTATVSTAISTDTLIDIPVSPKAVATTQEATLNAAH